MSKDYVVADVCFPKPRAPEEVRDGKEFWYPVVGVAFIYENKTDIRLDSVPLNWDGRLTIFHRKDKP